MVFREGLTVDEFLEGHGSETVEHAEGDEGDHGGDEEWLDLVEHIFFVGKCRAVNPTGLLFLERWCRPSVKPFAAMRTEFQFGATRSFNCGHNAPHPLHTLETRRDIFRI